MFGSFIELQSTKTKKPISIRKESIDVVIIVLEEVIKTSPNSTSVNPAHRQVVLKNGNWYPVSDSYEDIMSQIKND